jgi:membrane-associated phospholipid phosphatase
MRMTNRGCTARRLAASSLALLLLVVCQLLPAVCYAQSPAEHAPAERSLWRASWPTFSWIEGLATVAAGAGTLALALHAPSREPRWEGGILFDDAVTDAVRPNSAGARHRARRIGNVAYFAAPVIPLIIDPLIVALGLRGDSKAALNVGWMGLEAFSYAGLLTFAATRASARERPDSTECRRQHPDGAGCGDVDTVSFWSGHAAIAATSAGLTCANHRYLPLWGHPVADVSACVLTSAGALTAAVSRVASDRHYATDVLMGLGVGFGIGYSVPVLLHYSRTRAEVSMSLAPCGEGCLSLAGSF